MLLGGCGPYAHGIRPEVTAPSARRRQFRLAAAILLLIVVLGLAGAVYQVRSNNRDTQGPLRDHTGSATLNAIPINTDDPVSVGLDLPSVRVNNLTLTGVEPVGATPGLRILGYRVLRTTENKGGGLGSSPGFPTQGWRVHSLPGAEINGDAGTTQVVVGLQAEEDGQSHVLGFILHYTVGSTRYRALIRHGIVLCAPLKHGLTCDKRPGDTLATATQLQRALDRIHP